MASYPPTGQWTTDCCACFGDIQTCCLACWCPCIVVGRIADIVTEGHTDSSIGCWIHCLVEYGLGCGCLYSYPYRQRLREKFNLPEKPCMDCPMHWCCGVCSLTQEYRELANRGWKPHESYKANAARFKEGSTEAPPQQFMV